MAITKVSSRVLNRNPRKVKEASKEGPVFITDRGRPTHVLLTIEAYRQITGRQESIVDLLAMPGVGDIDYEPVRLGDAVRHRTRRS